ncbi:fasciclin domain-containing protein [Belliella marina]|uniref:Fasciclin domain-containing protein n=1 Tax=Belliella marina TaxID=1644146 RepID=A0ABW4VNW5_9BACT
MSTSQITKKALVQSGVWSLLLMLGLFACEFEPPANVNVSDDVNITDYIKRHPEQFSSLERILEVSNTASYLNAYGTYTFFAPTNEAVDSYLSEKSLNLNSLTQSEAADIVRFHLLSDTLSTASFTDGKLKIPTQYGKYLVTGAELIDGKAVYRVNRQATITESNVAVGNGVLHVIDNVLSPPTRSAAQELEANPDYSIFAEALKETGWYETLNQEVDGTWYTILAESNAVLAEAGFNSYAELRSRYSHLNDPTNLSDSLNLYIAYHVLPDIKFVADLLTATAHATKAPDEVITIRLKGTDVLVNEDVFFGVLEEGSPIVRPRSDIAVTNGVVHSVDIHFMIKLRAPTPVYWDVAEQAEIRQLTSVFRVAGASEYYFRLGELSRMSWAGGAVNGLVSYVPPPLNELFFNHGDYMRIQINANRLEWVQIRTPLLIRGRYKIWMAYRPIGADINCITRVSFNGQEIPGARLFDTKEKPPTLPEDELEARGWKSYLINGTNGDRHVARLIGIVDITTTGEQIIRFDRVFGNGRPNGGIWLDMIHFIPEDMDQIWPKFGRDGQAYYPD